MQNTEATQTNHVTWRGEKHKWEFVYKHNKKRNGKGNHRILELVNLTSSTLFVNSWTWCLSFSTSASSSSTFWGPMLWFSSTLPITGAISGIPVSMISLCNCDQNNILKLEKNGIFTKSPTNPTIIWCQEFTKITLAKIFSSISFPQWHHFLKKK